MGPVTPDARGIDAGVLRSNDQRTIWLAILFLIGFMLSNMTVLSWADYSYVMPASAMGYAAVTLVGVVFLGERFRRGAG